MPAFVGPRRALLGGSSDYRAKIQALFGASIIGWWQQTEPVPSAIAGTGTIAQTLTAITGVGTVFLSQIQIGDLLIGTGINGYVTAIANDTNLTLSSSTTVGASSFTYTRNISIDSSGQANNGLYRSVTLGQNGIGGGLTSAFYDGAASFDNIYSAALNADVNTAEGTMMSWIRMSAAGVWTDATARRMFGLQVDANNAIRIGRTATDNTLRLGRLAGSVDDMVDTTILGGSTGWFHAALTWSMAADQLKAYINGVQVGTTQTTLGTWAGALSTTQTLIGATNTIGPSGLHSGYMQHSLILNRPATASEISSAANP